MSRLKKEKSPWRAELGARKKVTLLFEKKGKSPWRAKLGAKKMQKRLKQKKHDQVKKAMSKHQKQISHW